MSEKGAVSLTPVAVARLRTFLKSEDGSARSMRIDVEPGGCAGLLYEVSFDGVATASDVVIESDGVQVLLSPDSARYMKGAVIDFAENSLIVQNPNAASACSCGASFTSKANSPDGTTSTKVN